MRRSGEGAAKVPLRHLFHSPYRCRTCRKVFWSVSSRVYRRAIIIIIIIVVAVMAGAIGVGLVGEPRHDTAEPEGAPPDAAHVEATVNLAKQNNPVAEHELAKMYASGRGVPQSEKERLVWLERSAEHGNADAQYEMGMALRYGRGVIQDYGRAAIWLERAAQSGNGLAQFELGLMYRGDAGIAADNVKAYTWLNLAAAQGIVGADAARDTVLRKLSPAEISEAQAEARRLSEAQGKQSTVAR